MALPQHDVPDAPFRERPPIGTRPPRRLGAGRARRLGLAVTAVTVILVGCLVAATVEDSDGAYPGARSGSSRSVVGALQALPGAAVDDFEHPVDTGLGPFPGLGTWRTTAGTWQVVDGLGSAAPDPGRQAVATVAAHRAMYLFQVDVFRAQPGSGVVFRYRDSRNHWMVTYLGGTRWNLTKVRSGKPTVVRTFTATAGALCTVGVWVKGPVVQVAVGAVPAVRVRDATFEHDRRVGLLSSSAATHFDDVSVYDG